MADNRSKIDFGIVAWLVALSFWSGVSFMQIQINKEMIIENRDVRVRIWEKLDKMQHDLDIIAGYIKAKEKYDN